VTTPAHGVLHVVEDEPSGNIYALVGHPQRKAPIARLPPVPTGAISDATAKRLFRAMLDDGRVASTGAPPALLIAMIVAVATVVAVITAIWSWT